jgi:antitoxin component of MazEF toxin-antitoxin module
MTQITIVSHGDGAAVVLPKTILESIGVHVGDTVEVTVSEQRVILRPLDEAERQRLVADLTQEVLDRRCDAYRRLA